MIRGHRIVPLVLPLVSMACVAEEPAPAPIRGTADAGGSGYVDLVVSYSDNGIPVLCDSAIDAICEAGVGACAQHEILGAPDGNRFELLGRTTIEVGLICTPVVDRASNGSAGNDFRIWATINSGSGVISVSENGSDFTPLQNLVSDDQAFDLAEQGLPFIRFIRIIGFDANTSISIDAIEALP